MGFAEALAKRPADAHTHVQEATRAGVHPIVPGTTRGSSRERRHSRWQSPGSARTSSLGIGGGPSQSNY